MQIGFPVDIKTLTSYCKSHDSAIKVRYPKKPLKPILRLPRIEQKYINISNLIENELNPWEVQEIFQQIWQTDNPALQGVIRELFMISKLCLDADFSKVNARLQSYVQSHNAAMQKYQKRYDDIVAEQTRIHNEITENEKSLRESWKTLVEHVSTRLNTLDGNPELLTPAERHLFELLSKNGYITRDKKSKEFRISKKYNFMKVDLTMIKKTIHELDNMTKKKKTRTKKTKV